MATPSPEQTPLVADANTNANSTVGQTNTNTTDLNSNTTVVTGGAKTVSKATPGQTAKAPTTKAPTKPKGGDDRTKILQ